MVSHEHGFVFFKARKTAGTAIELALSAHLGADDVLAPGGPSGEFIRADQGGRPPQNFATDPDIERRYLAALHARDKTRLRALSRENIAAGGFKSHMNAEDARRRLDPVFWDRALKFTAERHPYDKAVSLACFRSRATPGDPGFAEMLDETVRDGKYPGFKIYSIDGEPVIDDWLLPDTMEEDAQRICAKLGIDLAQGIPRVRATGDRAPAAEVLSDEQKAIVRRRCAPEFDFFGWAP